MFVLLYGGALWVVLLHRGSSWTAILRSRPLMFLGLISYGVYLYHQACLGLLHGFFFGGAPSLASASRIWTTLTALLLSFLLAFGSHVTLERYFLRLGRKLTANF
jgi:peptidoglycan/LPS O-acetylase OafA/YrhL